MGRCVLYLLGQLRLGVEDGGQHLDGMGAGVGDRACICRMTNSGQGRSLQAKVLAVSEGASTACSQSLIQQRDPFIHSCWFVNGQETAARPQGFPFEN